MSLKNDAINLVVALKGFTLPSKDAELAYNKLCNQLSKNHICTWVGLTDSEIRKILHLCTMEAQQGHTWLDFIGVARTIEAKLKEKNT